MLGQYDEAVVALKKALQMSPDYLLPTYSLPHVTVQWDVMLRLPLQQKKSSG